MAQFNISVTLNNAETKILDKLFLVMFSEFGNKRQTDNLSTTEKEYSTLDLTQTVKCQSNFEFEKIELLI